jgi:hypothetical protein
MWRPLAIAFAGVWLTVGTAMAEPAPPPVIHVGLRGGAGPLLSSSKPDTTGFSWSVEFDGSAPGIGESGLGFREMRLTRNASTPDTAFTALFRQVKLRSSVLTVPPIALVLSWQGGVVMQDFQKGELSGVKTGLPGVKESMIGGELGVRLDWHLARWFSPYLAIGGIGGSFVNPAVPVTATAGGGGPAFGFDGIAGIASRVPLTIPWGDERYGCEIGGKAELYFWNLLDEQLVGLDFRLGTYF